ncbi:MAG: UDP-N-acetylenolpyruvoylglucosamine reductase, partial [Halioglobus sp.]|nr:UDP-N-acetylenolpyruvoylglucosamine reductase [Halioglobus sp.]
DAFVVNVHAIAIATGEQLTLAASACEFGYRDSVFKRALRDQLVITAVDLRLPLQPCVDTRYPALAAQLAEQGITAPTPNDVFAAVVAIRTARLPDPAEIPNAGSFFKNPIVAAGVAAALKSRHPAMPVFAADEGSSKLSAAWLIDQCGWKGHLEGGVGVHERHALVLVHLGGSTGAELLALAARIQDSVAGAFGIDLEIEPRVYGVAS